MIPGKELSVEGRLFRIGEASFVQAEMWRDEAGNFWLESVVDPAKKVDVGHITPQVGRTPCLISLTDNRRFETTEPLPIGFSTRDGASFIRKIEKFGFFKSLVLLLLVVAFLAGFRALVPTISDVVLPLVPQSFDVALGDQVEETVDGLLFAPSELAEKQQQELRELFAPLSEQVLGGTVYRPQVLFRSSSFLGPNALAVPNGTMIMTDDLVRLFAEEPAYLQAVYAHELAHIRARHGMRQLLRYTILSVMAYAIGIDESILEEMALVLSEFARAGYTRDFEREADILGAQILQKQGLDPMLLARALIELEQSLCGEGGCGEAGILATHPDVAERVRLIEQASQ